MHHMDWLLDHTFPLVPAQAFVGRSLATFQEFPPREKVASSSLDQAVQELLISGGSK
jgi:arylsulfatase